jgi:hypothetical protein
MPSTRQAVTLSWCVVKPNAPVAGRTPAFVPTPLRFLAASRRPLAPAADAAEGIDDLGTLFQAVGPVMLQMPFASELQGPAALVGFVPLR